MTTPATDPHGATLVSGPKSLILMYHRVDRSERDRWHLCVSPDNFAAQVRCLKEAFNPVRFGDLATNLISGGVRHRDVAITFDDGYLDNLKSAMPILKAEQVHATFFISGPGTAVGDTFWWEVLEAALPSLGLTDAAAQQLHGRLMVAGAVEREEILAWLPRTDVSLPPRMNARELLELSRDPLVEIGAHGWSHRALGSISVQEQDYEIRESVAILTALTGVSPQFFAYPFGGPFNVDTVRLLRERGIKAAACTVAEPVMAGCDPMALPRMQVEDWDAGEFKARLSAILHD